MFLPCICLRERTAHFRPFEPFRFPESKANTPLVGGRKGSFPQLRAPPRRGNLEYSVLYCLLFNLDIVASFGVPTESATRTTPFLVFILEFAVSLLLLTLSTSFYGGTRPLVRDALAEKVRGSNASCLPPVCASTHTLYPPLRARRLTPLFLWFPLR